MRPQIEVLEHHADIAAHRIDILFALPHLAVAVLR